MGLEEDLGVHRHKHRLPSMKGCPIEWECVECGNQQSGNWICDKCGSPKIVEVEDEKA